MRYYLATSLILIIAGCGQKQEGHKLETAAEWKPVSVFGISATQPPLVLDAVSSLNSLVAELLPAESKKSGPAVSPDEISVILDPKEFASSIQLFSPQAKIDPNDAALKALAFVILCEGPIWINWSNPEIQLLQKNYLQGDKQTVSVLASVLVHELGHISSPDDPYAAHLVQLTVLEEFQKRGQLSNYAQIIDHEKIRVKRPHPCSR